jgi:hypothetical protein
MGIVQLTGKAFQKRLPDPWRNDGIRPIGSKNLSKSFSRLLLRKVVGLESCCVEGLPC